MKTQFFILSILLSFLCSCKEVTTYESSDVRDFKMINNSGVEVVLLVNSLRVGSDMYNVPEAAFILDDGDEHEWVAGGYLGSSLYTPFVCDINTLEARVYFDKTILVRYSRSSVDPLGRDPRDFNSYKKESVGDNKYEYVYTFTVEDYQNALKNQK